MPRSRSRKRKESACSCDDARSCKKQQKETDVRFAQRCVAQHKVNYEESDNEDSFDEETLSANVYVECSTEQQAVTQTGSKTNRVRRLNKFEFFDECEVLQPMETSAATQPLFLRGVVQPIDGTPTKATGRFVAHFGPLIRWTVHYDATRATIEVHTDSNSYQCISPSKKYRPLFTHLQEQVMFAQQIYVQLLPKEDKAHLQLSFDTVLNRLQRSKKRHGYRTWRDAILTNGLFILAQLKCMSCQHDSDGFCFDESQFALALQKECEQNFTLMDPNGGVRIAAGSSVETMSADEILARQLQAKEDAKLVAFDRKIRGKISRNVLLAAEEDIADDYPVPAMYEITEDETDEFLMADENVAWLDPAFFPQRTLKDFAIYNAEGFLKSLELLPCWSGLAPVVELYGSGIVQEEEDPETTLINCTVSGGPCLATDSGLGYSRYSGGCEDQVGGCSSQLAENEPPSMRVYLSQIQEYVVDCEATSACISIRTQASWYRLEQPSVTYTPWFNTVIKWARIAVKIIGMLLNEARICKLSFTDIAAILAKESTDSDLFISANVEEVSRLLLLHGQFISNQFLQYPDPNIQNCSFVNHIRQQLITRKNCKSLLEPKKTTRKSTRPKSSCLSSNVNKNPMKDRPVNVRTKSMPATATALVQSIWSNYFDLNGIGEERVKEEENDLADDSDLTEYEADVLSSPSATIQYTEGQRLMKSYTHPGPLRLQGDRHQPWSGVLITTTATAIDEQQNVIHAGAVVACLEKTVVYAAYENGKQLKKENRLIEKGSLGMIQCFIQKEGVEKSFVQLRMVVKGSETVLGDAASSHELFLVDDWIILDLDKISSPIEDIHMATGTVDTKKTDFIVKLIYQPEKGLFESIRNQRLGKIQFNQVVEENCRARLVDKETFVLENEFYKIGDAIFFDPAVLPDTLKPELKENAPNYITLSRRDTQRSSKKMRPFGVGKIAAITTHDSSRVVKSLCLERYYRPEDIDQIDAISASYREVYASQYTIQITPADIVRKCTITPKASSSANEESLICTKKVEFNSDGGKNLVDIPQEMITPPGTDPLPRIEMLNTLDIFAGCGGLSEGLHQSGVAETKWAIEYDDAAAKAYKQNHPNAAVLCNNVSALLCRIMETHGQSQSCISCKAVQKQAKEISDDEISLMPPLGAVDLMVGGPPCQGYSGMNRFNKGQWSMMQNSMVLNYLSFADHYRPRYFLLENVRNFVSHNDSRTFRLTLRTLIEIGYQVRFGVLNAGNYGVPQSRKRTFIWGAAASEQLPDWPTPLHVFHSPQLSINLHDGIKYTISRETRGAPFRTVTVQDAISDLPAIENGDDQIEKAYSLEAQSEYQRQVRGDCSVLRDHICKKLSELNLERCRCIPKNTPGADWRTLLEIVAADPSREKFKGQPLVPWCLPNTAARHNNWRGLYGRLNKKGHFPTSTTDPQPMGKVGQVFHPEQDRIVSVRECARSQGFPDSYIFSGTIHQKHKQVGNAVPPPLAYALGTCLKNALIQNANSHTNE